MTSPYIKIETSLIAGWVKLLVRPYMRFHQDHSAASDYRDLRAHPIRH